jgi:hypothetical protein
MSLLIMAFFGNLMSSMRNLFNSGLERVRRFGTPVYNFLDKYSFPIQGVSSLVPGLLPIVQKGYEIADEGRRRGFYQKGGSVKRRKA